MILGRRNTLGGMPVAGSRAEQEYLAQRMKFARSADESLHMYGRTASDVHLCGDSGSPLVASVGGKSLTLANTIPSYAQPSPYAGKLGVAIANDSNTTFQPPLASDWEDDGVTSFAHLVLYRLGTVGGSGSRYGFGKSNPDWWFCQFLNDGTVRFNLNFTGVAKFAALPANALDGVDTWIWCSVDRTAKLAWCGTRYGTVSLDITGQPALVCSNKFRLAWAAGLNVEQDILYHARFEGADAEGDPAETMRRAARYAGG